MLFENYLTILPINLIELLVYIVAGLGVILITYAVFLEPENRQDLLFITGAGCLLIYALYIKNIIFTMAMIGLGGSALVEFIELYLGMIKHGKNEFKKYKK